MRKINMLTVILGMMFGLLVTITPAVAEDDFDMFSDFDVDVEPVQQKTESKPVKAAPTPQPAKTPATLPAKAPAPKVENTKPVKQEAPVVETKTVAPEVAKIKIKEEEATSEAPAKQTAKAPVIPSNRAQTFAEPIPQEKVSESDQIDLDDDDDDRETWLESLINRGTAELFNSQSAQEKAEEKRRLAKVLKNRRSNAANFDISGVKLRMKPTEVEEILTKQGFRRITQDFSIPNFIKWRGEELCRIHGIIGFERLRACAREIAAVNGFEYISLERYNRQATRETLEIHYTSTFTDNLSHYIIYTSNVPMSTSKASQNVYINNLKIYDFWRRIDMRYGQPDNTSEVKWGLGGKKPYLKAATGKLELVDQLLRDLDISRMLNEDSRLSNIQYYSF